MTESEIEVVSMFGIRVDHDEQALWIQGCGEFIGEISIPMKHLAFFIEALTIQLQKGPETLSASLCQIFVPDAGEQIVSPASQPADPSTPLET